MNKMKQHYISRIFFIQLTLLFSIFFSLTAFSGELIVLDEGVITTSRDSGEVAIGKYKGKRLNFDSNRIQANDCKNDPCTAKTLNIQREGGRLIIGEDETSHLILLNGKENTQYIKLEDQQYPNQSVRFGFNSGEPHRGLQIITSDNNGQAEFRFSSNGNAYKPGGGNWEILSDRRVKKNIKPYTTGLKAIRQINPVTYQFNGLGGSSNSGKEHVGILAQDIKAIEGLGEYSVDYSEKRLRKDNTEKTKLMTYDPSALLYVSVNALKELKAEINALKENNSKLEKKLERLKK